MLKVSLPRFLAHLVDVKKNRPDWPELDQVGWCLRNFRFSDNSAIYDREHARGPPLKTQLEVCRAIKKTGR